MLVDHSAFRSSTASSNGHLARPKPRRGHDIPTSQRSLRCQAEPSPSHSQSQNIQTTVPSSTEIRLVMVQVA